MKYLRVAVVHCGETGSRRLWVIAKAIEGQPFFPMQVLDHGIGIADLCVVPSYSTASEREFDLVFSVTCKTIKAKALLEAYLETSLYNLREINRALSVEDYLPLAPVLELVDIGGGNQRATNIPV